jgi:hypothetical protein
MECCQSGNDCKFVLEGQILLNTETSRSWYLRTWKRSTASVSVFLCFYIFHTGLCQMKSIEVGISYCILCFFPYNVLGVSIKIFAEINIVWFIEHWMVFFQYLLICMYAYRSLIMCAVVYVSCLTHWLSAFWHSLQIGGFFFLSFVFDYGN